MNYLQDLEAIVRIADGLANADTPEEEAAFRTALKDVLRVLSTTQYPAPYKLRVYMDRLRKARWRLVAPNGKTVATSGESYSRPAAAIAAAQRLADAQISFVAPDISERNKWWIRNK